MNRSNQWALLTGALTMLIIFSGIAGCLQQLPPSVSPGKQNTTPVTSHCMTGDILFLTENLYPFSYMEPDGEVHGQSVEVVQELQKRLNCSTRIEVHPWSTSYETALRTPGHAVFSTAKTPEREEQFAWVGPIASFEYVLYARNDSMIILSSLEAARNAGMIAVVDGDARHDFLLNNNFSTIRPFSSDAECLEALVNGSVSLFLGSSATTPEALRMKAISEGAVVPVYSLLTTDLYIAFNRETAPGIVRAYQDALDIMKADGTFSRITGSDLVSRTPGGYQENGDGLPVETVLSALSSLITTRMHGIAAAMGSLALTSDLQSGDWDRIRPILTHLEKEHPEARFWYANPDGSYYTTVDNLTSANLKDRSYFPGVLAGKTSIGTIVVSKSTGRYTAIIAVPVIDRGLVKGMLGTSIYCDTLEKTLESEILLPDGYYFFVLDSQGDPVLDSLPDRIFSLDYNTDARTMMYSRSEGSVSYRYDGSPHKAIFKTSDIIGWKVAIGWQVQGF